MVAGRWWKWGLAAAGLVLMVALARPALDHLRETPPPPAAPVRLSLAPVDGLAIGAGENYPFGLALSPDGRRLAYPASRDGDVALWLHDLASGRAEAVPGTSAALLPFWSPDGRRIGFFSQGRLRALDVAGDAIEDLADAPAPAGGTWLPSGDLIVAPRLDGGLMRYRAADRTWSEWTAVDRAAGETSHRLPFVTADGAHVVFYVVADRAARAGVWLAALDRPADRVRLTASAGHAIVAGDQLIYGLDGSLVAQRLDAAAPALVGRPALLALATGIGAEHQLFATAAADVLVYGEPASGARELVWTDRSGDARSTLAGPVHAWDLRIAPDGASVAVTRTDPQLATLDVWVYDGDRPMPRRISPALDVDDSPIWAPDGVRLAWISARTTVMVRGRQAMLPEDRLHRFEGRARLWDWSSGGQLVVGVSAPGTRDDLWIVDARGTGQPTPYAQTTFNEVQAAVAPDGRSVAYASDESGRFEIYVDRFPRPGSRVRITADGGADPRWRADGRELVFRRGNALYAASIGTKAGAIEALGTSRLFDAGPDLRAYDMTRDGRRFVLNRPMPGLSAPAARVVVNWATGTPAGQ